jgi:hypothetical protein
MLALMAGAETYSQRNQLQGGKMGSEFRPILGGLHHAYDRAA